MSTVSTHVLDTARGRPAAGVPVVLEGDGVRHAGVTDGDGRVPGLVPSAAPLAEGIYTLTFDTDSYFHGQDAPAFYPQVTIQFRVGQGQHYHVPLLLSPYGYSTYRGS